jgi:hypothetical protein
MMVGMMVMLAVVVLSRAEAHVMLVSHVKGPLYPTLAIDVKQVRVRFLRIPTSSEVGG